MRCPIMASGLVGGNHDSDQVFGDGSGDRRRLRPKPSWLNEATRKIYSFQSIKQLEGLLAEHGKPLFRVQKWVTLAGNDRNRTGRLPNMAPSHITVR